MALQSWSGRARARLAESSPAATRGKAVLMALGQPPDAKLGGFRAGRQIPPEARKRGARLLDSGHGGLVLQQKREDLADYAFAIVHRGKAVLRELLAEIRGFLAVRLRLALSRTTGICPANHGVDFAGCRRWADRVLPRKRNVQRAKKRFEGLSRVYARGEVSLDRVRSCMASFTGCMAWCKGWRSAGSALSKLVYPLAGGVQET